MDAIGLLDELRLRGLVRGVTHTVTIPAADLTSGLDAAVLVEIWPDTGASGDEHIVIERISSQGIAPSNLTIVAADQHRSNFRLLLDANLVSDRILIGDSTRGVKLEIRNNGAAAATVVIQIACMRWQDMRAVLDRIEMRRP